MAIVQQVFYERSAKQTSEKLFLLLAAFEICCETLVKMKLSRILFNLRKSKSSEVLTAYLKQCDQPPWTSYFIKVSLIDG